MEKKTIGKFISVLRKSQGMTQQDVADRLNVSNKAVSRWERDECAPDISLIPAIAEMFGVSCDELLRGEKISQTSSLEPKPQKTEKQLKNIITRALSSFKTFSVVSIILAFIGFVIMLYTSYEIPNATLGFAIMIVFEVCSFAISFLALNRAKSKKANNELFDNVDEETKTKYDNVLGRYSFVSFVSSVSAVFFSLPWIYDGYFEIGRYFSEYFIPLALVIASFCVLTKELYWVIIVDREKTYDNPSIIVKNLNVIQLSLISFMVIFQLFETIIWLETDFTQRFFPIIPLICLIGVVSAFVVAFVRYKENRKDFISHGIRNCIYFIPATFSASIVCFVGGSNNYRDYFFDSTHAWIGFIGLVLVSIVSSFIIKRKK